jgi:cell pole-organizing protein PopZ
VTQRKEQQEPSMEEILSSIRRIIADESSAEEGAQDPAERDRDADELPQGFEDAADEDVLELTEVVREEGEVIELDRAMAQPQSIEPWPVAARAGEPDQHEPGPDEPDQHEPGPDEQDWASAGAAPAALARDPATSGWAGEEPTEHAARSPIDIQDDEMEEHQTAMQQKKKGIESLVSDRAAGAATGAFARLSQAVQRTPPELAIADEAGRSVEQFIEDMMRPMLQEWLDQNLPVLVERIVQKEIQKIARRAEEA